MIGYGCIGQTAIGQGPYPAGIAPVLFADDGGYARKKRKSKPYDAALDEQKTRTKRREAIYLAIHGPEVEYQLPALVLPFRAAKPDVGDLPQAILQARVEHQNRLKAQAERDDEDDLEAILREIL